MGGITIGSVFCGKCATCLDDLSDLPNGERAPCPKCGSKLRNFEESAICTIGVSTYGSALQSRQGKAIGYSESERDGRAASADQHEDGSVSFELTGSSPQGEEDTLQVCRMLVDKLNVAGDNWGQPVLGEALADCRVVHQQYKGMVLEIQVVRAITDQTIWKELNEHKHLQQSGVTKDELAEHIRYAIESKTNQRRIPRLSRADLTLALDANRLPALGFDEVVDVFRSKHGTWCQTLGFAGIWLVGPSTSLTWRLDSAPGGNPNPMR